jgi:ABC-2 type transport system ATP-binding protein
MTDATATSTSTAGHSNSANEFAIETKDLSKTYSQGLVFKQKHRALENVSLTVQRGEIFGMLGPNGAGKTTFLKIMLGIIRKTSGQASLLGYAAGSRQGRQLVGYLPEHLRVPAHLTGYQALEFFGNLSNVPTSKVREKRDELLETVGLAQRAKDNVRQYSKGMLQRLGLAQALLHDPELLVLDEPTDGLDPKARAEMRQIIRKLQERGVTIFLNSHLLQEVEMICQRVAILDKGILRYCGPVDTIGEFLGTNSTGHGGATVEFLLVGDEFAIRSCFPEPASIRPDPANNSFAVSIPATDQDKVDGFVDALRSAGVSIIGVTRRRVSLEDAFLALVDESSFKN